MALTIKTFPLCDGADDKLLKDFEVNIAELCECIGIPHPLCTSRALREAPLGLVGMVPNGWRYRQGRDLAEKATRRRIRRWGRLPESAGKAPHLSGARGVGRVSTVPIYQDESHLLLCHELLLVSNSLIWEN